jgi:dTDP-4-dehydrorhamnose reductase
VLKALVVGAGGQVGGELIAEIPDGFTTAAFGRSGLDLTDEAAVREVVGRERPDIILNAAGYTRVDRAEEEADAAFAVNAEGAERLAREAERVGARLIHLSTDYVFDGARGVPYGPDDPPAPLSVYGASKLEGERRALAAAPGRVLIVRSAWLYSSLGDNFVKLMLARMRAGEALRVVADQVGSPTWAGHLADALWRMAARPDLAGVLHFVDAGVASWYDFAVAIQDEALAAGLLDRPVAIAPVRTLDYVRPARRPPYSVLDATGTREALGLVALPWRWALRAMLAELAAGAPLP